MASIGLEGERLGRLAKEALVFLGQKDSYIEVNLVTGGVMKSLNARFRGKNQTTNVLSFGASKVFPKLPKKAKKFLGEVYLDQAYIKSRGENLEHLLIHGLLHLLDFSHERYDDRIKMERLENKLLKWQKIKS